MLFRLIGLAALCMPLVVVAAEDPITSKEKAANRRMALMQEAQADCRVSARANLSGDAIELQKTPLLRYDDPTRGIEERRTDGLLDATVWRMGKSGRPTALITLEIYRAGEARAVLCYEFLSLTSAPFELVSPRGPQWTPSSTTLKMSPLEDASSPADSGRARLTQMRQLARRFSVQEEIKDGIKIACRLLSQPIDRYAGGREDIVDGAIFAFANGTNPEAGLLLECDDKMWRFGLVRLSSAGLFARLDHKPIWEVPRITKSGEMDPYVGMPFTIDWQE
jgi:hypothetical protein